MAEMYGYAGSILQIDLTTETVTKIPSSKYLPENLGGRGLAAKLYWDFVPADCGPLDPENCLIITSGPLTATGAAMSCIGICTGKAASIYPKSTYFICTCSGDFTHEMKYAGYDAMIVTGKASRPVYLSINDDKVEIKDAGDLWGTTTRECRYKLVDAYGSKTMVACIGPAGENLVAQAVINTDCNTAWAQGGYGAVMGSKSLKAIAVRGTGSIKVAEPEKILELNEAMRKLQSMKDGEVREYKGKEFVGKVDPTLSVFYPNPKSALNIEEKAGTCHIRKAACPGCYLMCKTKVEFEDKSIPGGAWDCGETVFMLTSEMNYYKQNPYGRHNRACSMYNDELGLDIFFSGTSGYSIFDQSSLKMMVDFSNKGKGAASSPLDVWYAGYLDGILTEENTGLPWSIFGSEEFMRTWLHNLAYRVGFSDIIANGMEYACDYIANHEEFGPNRGKMRHYFERTSVKAGVFGGVNRHALMLGYGATTVAPWPPETLYSAVNSKRGREPHGVIGIGSRGAAHADPMWVRHFYGTDKLAGDYWGPDLAKAVVIHEYYANEADSMPFCTHNSWISIATDFFAYNDPAEYCKYSMMADAEYLSAVLGKHITQEDLFAKDEVAVNYERAIWLRDGYLKGGVDTFWDCVFDEVDMKDNILIPRDKFEHSLQDYYNLRGWVNGVPKKSKLEELGMQDVAKDLADKYHIAVPD